MGLFATAGNIYFTYTFLKKLVTPFNKTKAFELGIIDERGNVLRKKSTLRSEEERDAYTLSDRLIWNLKRLIEKIPGGKTKIASYAAALFLLKEHENSNVMVDEKEMERLLTQYIEDIENDTLSEQYHTNMTDKEFVQILRAYDEEHEDRQRFYELASEYTGLNVETLEVGYELDELVFMNENLDRKFEDFLVEEEPTTSVAGVDIYDKPLFSSPPKGLKQKKFAGVDVFVLNSKLFDRSRHGKSRYHSYAKYVGEDDVGKYIRHFCITNPKKPIAVMDSSTGAMQFLRYGNFFGGK